MIKALCAIFVLVFSSVQSTPETAFSNPEPTPLTAAQMSELIASQREQIAALTHQLEWFRRQLFGQKSERFVPEPNPAQMHLGEVLPIPDDSRAKMKTIGAHTRRVATKDLADNAEEIPFFDESKVPVESITILPPEAKDVPASELEVIGEKITFRLAQRPGSYVILKYCRPVLKRKDTQAIVAAPAPAGFLEGSRADVSFAAGLLMDKFAWHLPLYRQHQRLSRRHPGQPALAHPGRPAHISLLAPIYEAQLASIRQPRQSHGRDPDQSRALRPRQDEDRLFLAGLRGAR